MNWRTVICIALGISLFFSVACAAKGYADGYADGRSAGWADCNPTRQFVAGFALSLLYVGYAAVSPAPAPPSARMSDIALETNQYQEGYIAGYQSGWSSRRLINALGGAASWLVILAIISGA